MSIYQRLCFRVLLFIVTYFLSCYFKYYLNKNSKMVSKKVNFGKLCCISSSTYSWIYNWNIDCNYAVNIKKNADKLLLDAFTQISRNANSCQWLLMGGDDGVFPVILNLKMFLSNSSVKSNTILTCIIFIIFFSGFQITI
ncbi:hypothetical protein MXB_3504 [Myxobolus squamalis]|nr:hypothetical protein MXB_3504 [Myxobolus squamalis]